MLVIGITGGTGSGKTTIVEEIKKEFSKSDIGFISQDSYYNDNGNLSFEEKNRINFDHPDAVDFDLMIEHLKLLKNGKNVNQPIYSFFDHNRTEKTKLIEPKKIIVIEGLLILTNKKLSDLIDIKVFINSKSDLRFNRRLNRDINERGRSEEEVIELFNKRLNEMHKLYVEPMMKCCDIIIDNNTNNSIEVDPLINIIKNNL
ncbi:MAG: uridine kinase [Flavobacteriales bacterium]|nr:uridine kinase [Flavobacteriaceae bacterium]RZP07020.1 MAG: uridine kinase [Flavobacteriales bacterium]|tara:strand:+ start:1875 stop:2480 length:606 start_codon:yes stop_codon:yes gene_type:complete